MNKYKQRFKRWLVRRISSSRSADKFSRLTREGLADVEAGRVFDHHVVQVWADSLNADSALSTPLPQSALMWSSRAVLDLMQLYQFLSVWSPPSAAQTVQKLTAAPIALLGNPTLGECLSESGSKDIRRVPVGHYEIVYQRMGSSLCLLRVRHLREYRYHDH
ncbi:type II toxin-antitoxin system RelE/ParE family toxin [Pseudomonas chlororaphis]|uniref:type II toxin-antitoxin system RelE/ParE family toxin n=1 Tax=Pseudomonas chlororaphis TaxID=587753 RepID=UPI001F4BE925|nr:type II toxin-antitoxin system RelE/ParE family toxin [Pseudomonas chlororaphis]